MRLVLSSMVLLALSANPTFAKNSHAPHGDHVGATSTAPAGKDKGGANPSAKKTNGPIDAGATIAPPVLAPHGVMQHQIQIVNPNAKKSLYAPHVPTVVTTSTAPIVRNAIGQPVATPKDFGGGQHTTSSLQPGSGVVTRPLVPPTTGRLNVAAAANRGSNGVTVRPTVTPSGIGGPTAPRYGINGTTVQNRH